MSTDQYMSRARESLGQSVIFTEIGAWWDAPGFLEIIAQRVTDALALVDPARLDTTEVLFSAHSLPQKILATGDTYPNSCATARRAPPAWRHHQLRPRLAVRGSYR